MSEFIMDVEKIRRDARKNISEGAVTVAYQADKEKVLQLLDAAMATEWLCVLRYTQHSLVAQGIHADFVATHFKEHALEEQQHAQQLGERMKQLGGHPSLDPSKLQQRAHSEYKEADSLSEMIKENLIAERIAIESYTEIIRFIGDRDPTTRRMLVEILKTEEEHADEMADLLTTFDPTEKLH